MSITLRNLQTSTVADNLTLVLKSSPLTNDEIDQNFINLNLLKISADGTIDFTGNQTFTSGITLTNDPSITLTSGENLTIGDSTNKLVVGGIITDLLTLTTPVNITVTGDCSLNTTESFDGNGDITLDISVDTVSGSVNSATKLTTPRNFSITGDITASEESFNGTGDVVLNSTIANNTITPNKISSTGTFNFPELQVSGGKTIGGITSESISITVPDLAANESDKLDVSVTGAELTSFVIVQPSAALTGDISISGVVTSSGTVTLYFHNVGAASYTSETLNFNFLLIL